MELDWIETSLSRDVLVQASMLPDGVRNAREHEVDLHYYAVNLSSVNACNCCTADDVTRAACCSHICSRKCD